MPNLVLPPGTELVLIIRGDYFLGCKTREKFKLFQGRSKNPPNFIIASALRVLFTRVAIDVSVVKLGQSTL